MRDHVVVRGVRPPRPWAILLVVLGLVLSGCQAQEPSLSPAAAAFKKEVKDCMAELSRGLAGPVSQGNVQVINETLQKIEPETAKLCRHCPFRIAILDKNGDTITVYPFRTDAVADFSNYDLVIQVFKNRRVAQQRLYLQDGSQVYIVCAPLLRGEDLVGLVAISMNAKEAKSRWGVTEQEFLAMDFNR